MQMNRISSVLKVLIVGEDESVNPSLNSYGYKVVSIQKNVPELEYTLSHYAPDIVLIALDAKTANDSFALGHFLHKFGAVPFIYLSTSTNSSLLFKAQKTHPHGYHVKPFDPINLHTSIECAFHCFKKNQTYNAAMHQLRNEYEELKKKAFNVRSNQSKIKICDCYQFNLQNYSLFYQNNEIKLTKKERALITLLIAQLGSIVDFKQIILFVWGRDLRTVWGGEYQTHHDVRTLVWRLNKKIPIPIIQNAMGIGYYIEQPH